MNSLWTGSTWLLTTAAALSPLIALLIGFAGTDRLLRWQLAEKRDRASLKGAERYVVEQRGGLKSPATERQLFEVVAPVCK
jgi:hypothetical protein